MWRVEGWTDVEINYYPKGNDSSYRNLKFVGRIRQNVLKSWYHQFQYEWFARDYSRKNARNGAGAETLSNRVDNRNRIRAGSHSHSHKKGNCIRQKWWLLLAGRPRRQVNSLAGR